MTLSDVRRNSPADVRAYLAEQTIVSREEWNVLAMLFDDLFEGAKVVDDAMVELGLEITGPYAE